MSVRMVRVQIQPGKVAEVDETAKKLFAALESAQPGGVRYASSKLPDGQTYVILLALDDDDTNPLAAIPAFQEFQASLGGWVAQPPVIEQLTPIGSYRLF